MKKKEKEVKKPKRLVLSTVLSRVDLILCIVASILLVLNMCIFDNDCLRGFILGVQLIFLLNSYIIFRVSKNNTEIDIMEFEEHMNSLREKFTLKPEDDDNDSE